MLDTQFGSLKFDNPKNPVANNRKPMNINQKAYLEDTLINNDYTPFNNTHIYIAILSAIHIVVLSYLQQYNYIYLSKSNYIYCQQ